jgi:adenylate cyclase
MGTEIERRFRVCSDAWRDAAVSGTPFVQGYLSNAGREGATVRVRRAGDRAWITIKGPTRGTTRAEFEYAIPPEEASELLHTLAVGEVIQKVRHRVPVGRHVFEVDVFSGNNAGLVVAEVELSSEDEAFEHPAWLGEEVSHDGRLSNAALAQIPYRSWALHDQHWDGQPETTAAWDPPQAAVLAAIAALVPGDYVATDADGTLWAGDGGDEAVRWVAAAYDPSVDVAAYLHREEVDYGGACRQAAEILSTVADLDAETSVGNLQTWLGRVLKPRVWLVDALRAAEARGVEIVVVTAAPLTSALRGLRATGLPAWPVVGIEVDGVGAVVEPAPVDEGKPLAFVQRYPVMAALALGDSRHDIPLLQSAKVGFWLRPAQALNPEG